MIPSTPYDQNALGLSVLRASESCIIKIWYGIHGFELSYFGKVLPLRMAAELDSLCILFQTGSQRKVLNSLNYQLSKAIYHPSPSSSSHVPRQLTDSAFSLWFEWERCASIDANFGKFLYWSFNIGHVSQWKRVTRHRIEEVTEEATIYKSFTK